MTMILITALALKYEHLYENNATINEYVLKVNGTKRYFRLTQPNQ